MAEKRAGDGGAPIRTRPWPRIAFGAHLYGEEEKRAAIEVIEAQSPFRFYGLRPLKRVEQFEREAAEQFSTRYALAMTSGTTALQVTLAALDVGPGTEVILPGFLWISNVAAVVNLRAIPVFAEVEPSLGLDPDDLKRRITPRTRAIVAIHMAGAAAAIDAIKAVADPLGIPVVEDYSQAAGARVGGRPLGAIGVMGAASLQFNKNFTTGEGGLITTSDARLDGRARCYHDLGFERDALGVSSPLPGRFETWGLGARMDEIRGAIGVVQLRRLPELVRTMRENHAFLSRSLSDFPGIALRPSVDPFADTGSHLVWTCPTVEEAKATEATLRAEGIPAMGLHPGLHQVRYMTTLFAQVPVTTGGCPWQCPLNLESAPKYWPGMLPRTDDLIDRSRMLPLPPTLQRSDLDDVVAAFAKLRP